MNSTLFLKYLLYIHLGIEPTTYETQPTPHCYVMRSDARLPSCNRVCADDQATAQEIQQLVASFGDMPFRWFVYGDQHTLQQTLENNGFAFSRSYPAMSIDLDAVHTQTYGPDIEVKKIGIEEIDLWISIVAQSYNTDAPEFTKFIHYLIKHTPTQCLSFYIGYYQGTPVATSMTIRHDEIVGLHWVATLPEYRGKGVGFAISHKPLLDAQAQGCTQAILLATTMGKPVYEKIGFKEYAECKVYGNENAAPPC